MYQRFRGIQRYFFFFVVRVVKTDSRVFFRFCFCKTFRRCNHFLRVRFDFKKKSHSQIKKPNCLYFGMNQIICPCLIYNFFLIRSKYFSKKTSKNPLRVQELRLVHLSHPSHKKKTTPKFK